MGMGMEMGVKKEAGGWVDGPKEQNCSKRTPVSV